MLESGRGVIFLDELERIVSLIRLQQACTDLADILPSTAIMAYR
jgi:hypothetical protein